MTGSERAVPTAYPDVNSLLQGFLVHIQAILGDSFIGMYLYGSLAQGDFNHESSDIDFIVITEREVTDDQFALLDEMHKNFRAGDSYWAEKIEASYIQKDALNLPSAHSAKYPQLEKGRDFTREPVEIGWSFQRAVLRNQGIVIAGPDLATLIAAVPTQELADADSAITRMWQQQSRSDPSWLAWVRQRDAHRFFIVTLCRSLYRLEHGTLASKVTAAQWGQEALDGRWATLIARSLAHRDELAMVTDQELVDTLAFLDYTVDRLTDSPATP